MNSKDISDTIQLMRTLTLAQVRKQMEQDAKFFEYRFKSVADFFKAAKEQTK